MNWNRELSEKSVVFNRLSLSVVNSPACPESRPSRTGVRMTQRSIKRPKDHRMRGDGYSVLVINSGQEMAKEITLQLSLQIPGCSLMYAPTLQLAAWMLKRQTVDLIVSDPILPDGNVLSLREVLETMEDPPDLVVVGEMNEKGVRALGASGYTFSEARRRNSLRKVGRPSEASPVSTAIKGLGADLRNDLNNPLQEIVAMVFVARAHGKEEPGVSLALNAIEKAAMNMGGVVRGLEDKIRKVVQKTPQLL